MEEIEEILSLSPEEAISKLKNKSVSVPGWSDLVKEYETKNHPVMDKQKYPDVVSGDGVESVTRVPLDLMKVTARRMTELVCGIPVKRLYKPADIPGGAEAAALLEAIYRHNRINAVNVERLNMLFAGCEVATLWYATEDRNSLYGVDSPLKLRCRNYSPMRGDRLYPLFDRYGDLIALSFGYSRTEAGKEQEYFDTYTADRHIKFFNDGGWQITEDERTTLGKIPAVYMYRPTPVWENNAPIVYEMEWALSRNGNYLRRNSKPVFAVFADDQVQFGGEKSQDKEYRTVMQFPAGSNAQYITWAQAVENLKFYVQELRSQYFSSLQMPDFSMDNMKTVPMSGEARKMVFLDAQMKVQDESGRILEFLDREMSVVKSFARIIAPSLTSAIDLLPVDMLITPYRIDDPSETIQNIMTATAGKPILSQLEGIRRLDWSDDPEQTQRQIIEEAALEAGEMTL